MPVIDQVVTDKFAFYCGDSAEVLRSVKSDSVGMAIYSPPFATESGGALYNYSSSPRDLSNARSYQEFFDHYRFIASEVVRSLMPGRICAVHCMDVPKQGANICGYTDFPGDIIKLHESLGCDMLPRICIWKEPLEVRNRTMSKALAHRQIVEDACQTNVAAADYLIPFRKKGVNPQPVTHDSGFLEYFGATEIPADLMRFKGWKGKQTENRYSHWIWRHYASCFWDDIRLDRVLPFEEGKEDTDERHQHPLQLDVIQRAVDMWTNPNDIVLTAFGGVASELVGPVWMGRRAIGCELKESYWRQGVKNLEAAAKGSADRQKTLFNQPPELVGELHGSYRGCLIDDDGCISDPVDDEIAECTE